MKTASRRASVWAAAAVAALSALTSASAYADPVNFDPGNNPQPDENVLFNESGLIATGTTVQGITNNTGLVVNFIGNGTEVLTTPSGGQARIEAVDGAFNVLTVMLNATGATFESIIFNIDAGSAGTVKFTATDQNNATTTSGLFNLGGSGSNFFTITTDAVTSLSSLKIDSTADISSVQFDDLGQIRIGGSATPAAVPLPAVAWGGIVLMSGLGVTRRLRSRKAQPQ